MAVYLGHNLSAKMPGLRSHRDSIVNNNVLYRGVLIWFYTGIAVGEMRRWKQVAMEAMRRRLELPSKSDPDRVPATDTKNCRVDGRVEA
jgi:hypothetical protein